MFFNKKVLMLILAIFFIISTGWIIYKKYNSVENRARRLSRSEIIDWFYSIKSLTHDKLDVLKNDIDKNQAIRLRKIVDGLSNEWEFEYEDWNLFEAGQDAFLFDYSYVFKNKESTQLKIFSNRYYYDLDEADPIPLKEELILKDGDIYKTLKVDKLWEGDFDNYCVKANYK